ncbi:MAG: hypothetical protein EA401_08750 [Planctomycetota bacterium]|nr:MAG: hypothetical protein EA401_08750 [Planctomycetota bacterium]
MKSHTCLIAGPLILDQLGDQPDILGGGGFYAAAAAAPFALSQLWTRAGDLDGSLRRVITARHIDEAGIAYEGTPYRHHPDQGLQGHGPFLAAGEPVSTEDLACALLIHLPFDEWQRARAACAQLHNQVAHTLISAPHPQDIIAEPSYLATCCQESGAIILPAHCAMRATSCADPLSAARVLQDMGAKIVCLSAGVLGGLACYQQKITTWHSLPTTVKDATGIGASFAGALCGSIAEHGKCDWRTLKRALAQASAVASLCASGIGPKKLLSCNRSDYTERFTKLRRNAKT